MSDSVPDGINAASENNIPSYYLHVRSEILSAVPSTALNILDVGCAAGMLGKALKEKDPARRLVGIELDAFAASFAKRLLDAAYHADVESFDPPFQPGEFDCIVFADVLEHLRDPWATAEKYVTFLKPGGTLIASVPNVRYLPLLRDAAELGLWEYQEEGILDKSHLRFFTKRQFLEMMERLSVGCDAVEYLYKDPLHVIGAEGHGRAVQCGNLLLMNVTDEELDELRAFQFVFVGTYRPGTARADNQWTGQESIRKAGCGERPEQSTEPLEKSASEGEVDMGWPVPMGPKYDMGRQDLVVGHLEEIHFQQCDYPKISIIIPVMDKWMLTYHCLSSILEHTKEIAYEVIIVDDGSTDETIEMLGKVGNITLLRNEKTRGFVFSCNKGIGSARGEYVLFLNNDTVVTEGWLTPMAALLDNSAAIGAVGAKLILPDGTLQEAGCIVWNDGSTAGYGGGENPEDPRFCYVRDVDYCSCACLLVRKELLYDLGGFDEVYSPAYYEDADLCFEVRRLGYRVVYQPAAKIIHHQFGSSSREEAMALYLKNMSAFAAKWRHVLNGQYSPKSGNVLRARTSRRGQRVLIIDGSDTVFDETGYLRSARDIAEFLMRSGYTVTFFSLSGNNCRQAGVLQQQGVEVFCGGEMTAGDLARERAGFYSALFICAPLRADDELKTLREAFPSARLIYKVVESGSKADGEEEKRTELLVQYGPDVVIVPSQGMVNNFSERGLRNVFFWGCQAEPKPQGDRPVNQTLADTMRKAFRGAPIEEDRCGSDDLLVQELRAKTDEMERYVTSLKETLAEKDKYVESLLEAVGRKDVYIASLLEHIEEIKKKIKWF